jgi:hypothetical protein
MILYYSGNKKLYEFMANKFQVYKKWIFKQKIKLKPWDINNK